MDVGSALVVGGDYCFLTTLYKKNTMKKNLSFTNEQILYKTVKTVVLMHHDWR